MRLSPAQEKVLTRAKARLAFYKQFDSLEAYEKYCFENEWQKHWGDWSVYVKSYNHEFDINAYKRSINNIVLCTADSRTLRKLESLGEIKIVDEGKSFPDLIQLLGVN